MVDSNGTEVRRFPNHGERILELVGISSHRAIVNVQMRNRMVVGVIAFDAMGTKHVLANLNQCFTVWKDRLVTSSFDNVELWEIESTPYGLRPVRVQRIRIHVDSTAILGLGDSLLVASFGGSVRQRSVDDSWKEIPCPSSYGWVRTMVMSMLEWKGFVFLRYLDGASVSKLCIWDTQWRVVRDISFDGRVFVGRDSTMCCEPGGPIFYMWSIRSWNPVYHGRYSRRVRDTIRTWMICSRNRMLPRDIAFLIAGMIVDGDTTIW